MAPGLEKFQILLDRSNHKFSPGENIAGRVIVDLNRPKSITNLRVRIKGIARVSWEESHGTGKNETTTTYRGQEVYFRLDVYLLGQPDGETVEIQTGSHVFGFSFLLPNNIPSSFDIRHASIRYTVKGIIERSWKFNHVTSIPFIVETPYDLTHRRFEILVNPIISKEAESYCTSCFRSGGLLFNVMLPTSAFMVGEIMQVKVHVNSEAMSARVTKVKLELAQETILRAQSPYTKTKVQSKLIQSVTKKKRCDKIDVINLSMPIPSLPLSDMVHCNIIDIVYGIHVIISVSGCHGDASRKYPIVIGTKPTANIETFQNQNMISSAMSAAASFSPVETPISMITEPMTSTSMKSLKPVPSYDARVEVNERY